jgi:hypothetical protein
MCSEEEFERRVIDALTAKVDYRTEWGLMLDCEKNGCNPHHEDDGRVHLWPDRNHAGRTSRPRSAYKINGHATRIVKRAIMTTPWETP